MGPSLPTHRTARTKKCDKIANCKWENRGGNGLPLVHAMCAGCAHDGVPPMDVENHVYQTNTMRQPNTTHQPIDPINIATYLSSTLPTSPPPSTAFLPHTHRDDSWPFQLHKALKAKGLAMATPAVSGIVLAAVPQAPPACVVSWARGPLHTARPPSHHVITA